NGGENVSRLDGEGREEHRSVGRWPARTSAVAAMATITLVIAGCAWRWPSRRTTTTTTRITATTATRPTTATTTPGTNPGGAAWAMWGHDYANTHEQSAERIISASTAPRLRPKWMTELKGDISATPTVADGTVYVPDWGGYLSALDARTG